MAIDEKDGRRELLGIDGVVDEIVDFNLVVATTRSMTTDIASHVDNSLSWKRKSLARDVERRIKTRGERGGGGFVSITVLRLLCLT